MTSSDSPTVSVILPTRNEIKNIEEVLTRIDRLGLCQQIIVVDDSDDATAQVAASVQGLSAEVIVHHRAGQDRLGGLGTAIVAGVGLSSSDLLVVMDADLQHPPELIESLIEPLDRVDLVVASRFNWDNVISGLSPVRRVASRMAGRLAFAIFPQALRDVSDPMSGFFAVRSSSLNVTRLNPLGYKILLEVLGTHEHLRVEEVPFSFGRRLHGESKAGVTEGIRFLRHVLDLRRRTGRQDEAAVLTLEGQESRGVSFDLPPVVSR